jgi:asparagine synthase (glutamine-hydrolysing)
MCGIVGYVGFDDEPLLRAMCASLVHRGPDGAGFYSAPGIGLAMRRLAVIDLKTGGQPIANETRDVWVVFNGEIYNYGELRTRLARRGHVLATTSDTETIVHLYEDHGLDFVQHLRGMFALALWDARRRRLVLVRDRIGEKPLYYAPMGGGLLFGSEIKAILQARRARAVDPQAVCEYLAAGYVAGSRSFFEGIFKLPPAHVLVHEAGSATVQRYWRPARNRNGSPEFSAAAAELDDRLNETVQLGLKSDVEVGAFLSGGIDSSVIVALMRRHNARVQTFSVGYGGEAAGFNELTYARRVADHLGTEHHELILGPRSGLDILPRILWHYDEPHGEPTSVLVYLLSEFTRRRVKVAMSGTGGDEIFYGYPRHTGLRLLQYYRWLPATVRRRLVERIVAKWPESTRGSRFAKRVKRFVAAAALPPAQAYLHWVTLLPADVRAELVSDRIRGSAADPVGDGFLRDHLAGNGGESPLDRAAVLDVEGYLPEYQLTYMDRMSMAHGLEVRAPLCDFTLVDFVLSLPASYRLRRTRGKHILKTIAPRWIPRDIAERRKIGFDSPIGQWFKAELRPFLTGFLARDHVARSGLLDPLRTQAMIAEHLSGRRDYSLQLWSVIALEAWYRMYVEDGVTDGTAYRLKDLRGAPPGEDR